MMGTPPAYIFIVRHGSRLDQADKNWHLTSPTPYDPPLTYGGWLQSQAVGARIAAILRQAEANSEQALIAPGISKPTKKRKKFKVAIHSSPFLRCVQTSAGISAGLAQAPRSQPGTPSPAAAPSSERASPYSIPAGPTGPKAGSNSPTAGTNTDPPEKSVSKITLRLDAFLGEWLNPEYYEAITRPPGSSTLLGNAKVGLLRQESISVYENTRPHASSVSSNHGRLWNSPKASPIVERAGSTDSAGAGFGLDGMTAMSYALHRNRAGSSASSSSQKTSPSPGAEEPPPGYVAPVPSYAISLSAKIPDGYVAHARDACSAIDYQWDSMTQWGDGGEYGEEWISMHRRFRKGFQHLVDWYAATEDPAKLVTQTVGQPGDVDHSTLSDDEEIETVVVLVSHGAGCNALIGAVTHQPVLMDVGVATLTMAARRDDKATTPESSIDAPSSGPSIPIEQYYDLKIQASNEHLRSLVPTGTGLSRAASVSSGAGQNILPQPRGRVSTISSDSPTPISFNAPDFGLPDFRSISANAADAGGARRPPYAASSLSREMPKLNTGITVGSGVTSFSKGLWRPSPMQKQDEDEDDDDAFPDFDGTKRFGTPTPVPAPPAAGLSGRGALTAEPANVAPPSERDDERDGTEQPQRPQPTLVGTSGLWGGGNGGF